MTSNIYWNYQKAWIKQKLYILSQKTKENNFFSSRQSRCKPIINTGFLHVLTNKPRTKKFLTQFSTVITNEQLRLNTSLLETQATNHLVHTWTNGKYGFKRKLYNINRKIESNMCFCNVKYIIQLKKLGFYITFYVKYNLWIPLFDR